MTVREMIQTITTEAPRFNSTIYVIKENGDDDPIDYDIVDISNGGTNDAIFITIKDWKG